MTRGFIGIGACRVLIVAFWPGLARAPAQIGAAAGRLSPAGRA
jgi:hypothetical protein